MTAVELAAAVRTGERSARDVVEEHLAVIEEREPELHAFNEVLAAEARSAAGAVDAAVGRGDDPGPLAGVPVALKDNLCTRGIPTTCSSKILEGWRPPYSATVVDRVVAAGGVPIGKTNLDEFAMGSSTENSAFGPTRNPRRPDRVPGGSSGGSAAAVAAGFAALGLGSDTGGSIRQPAALSGVVGVKPTYGAVSRYGLIAFASSLDQIGPLTNTVADAALLLEVIGGHDRLDSTSINDPAPSAFDVLGDGVDGLRVGPKAEFSVDEPIANSSRFVLPIGTPPAATTRSTTVAEYGGRHRSRIFDEHVVGIPRVHMLSLSATGTPASGPGSSPRPTDASTASAAARASSAST